MFFSERFQVDSELVRAYGAVDISLVCDMPLFVDPMLIFNSEKPEYQALHHNIIRYFHFLYQKSKQGLKPKSVLQKLLNVFVIHLGRAKFLCAHDVAMRLKKLLYFMERAHGNLLLKSTKLHCRAVILTIIA